MKRLILFTVLGVFALAAVVAMAPHQQEVPVPEQIFASPIHGGCYIAAPSDCRIHVEPFTIDMSAGSTLVQFQLIAIRSAGGIQTRIYDFRPDQSNPVPYGGTSYTPSLVAQDFAATCGQSYAISLQGKTSDDASIFNLGLTGYFTCPSNVP
jgi:hypothetical protein